MCALFIVMEAVDKICFDNNRLQHLPGNNPPKKVLSLLARSQKVQVVHGNLTPEIFPMSQPLPRVILYEKLTTRGI